MYDEREMNPALQELEAALRRMQPAKTGLNRDLLMFNAGRSSARSSRPWQALSGVLMVLLLGSMFIRPGGSQAPTAATVVSRKMPYRPLETPLPDRPRGDQDYLRLRQNVLHHGLDVLPAHLRTPENVSDPFNRDRLLKDLLSS